MSECLPVSVAISALNEGRRIEDAILSARKNNPFEVIVIEGGSTDNTYAVASDYADKVYQVEPYNLGYKRYYGVLKATQPYILIMDADQVFKDGQQLKLMLDELNKSGWMGIQPQLKSFVNDTYWQKGMEATLSLTHSTYGERKMIIGTPTLCRRDVLLKYNFNPEISGSCDDTDLCYRLTQRGYKLGISNAVCYQKHRATFKEVCKKFYWYGQGDFHFALLHPERALSIFSHPIKNYMFLKPAKLIKRGFFKYSLFPFVGGCVRHCGFWKGFLNFLIKRKKTDTRIAKRNDFGY
jgi:glycosyltransferase involved in cell wall biosynthesis